MRSRRLKIRVFAKCSTGRDWTSTGGVEDWMTLTGGMEDWKTSTGGVSEESDGIRRFHQIFMIALFYDFFSIVPGDGNFKLKTPLLKLHSALFLHLQRSKSTF